MKIYTLIKRFRLRSLYLLILISMNGSLFLPAKAFSQTITEKKMGYTEYSGDLTQETHKYLLEINKELKKTQEDIKQLYIQVNNLYKAGACEKEYSVLLKKINEYRLHISNLENSWKDISLQTELADSYGLWHQPETTLGQIVIDYGSQDYVYLLSNEISSIPLSIDSNLLIPRSSWQEMLDLILLQNGIGFKQLNPYLRQLYILKEDRSSIQLMTNKRKELEFFQKNDKVCFVLAPEPAEIKKTWLFLEKFINPNSTLLQLIGRNIFIIGPVGDIQDLLKLYDSNIQMSLF